MSWNNDTTVYSLKCLSLQNCYTDLQILQQSSISLSLSNGKQISSPVLNIVVRENVTTDILLEKHSQVTILFFQQKVIITAWGQRGKSWFTRYSRVPVFLSLQRTNCGGGSCGWTVPAERKYKADLVNKQNRPNKYSSFQINSEGIKRRLTSL